MNVRGLAVTGSDNFDCDMCVVLGAVEIVYAAETVFPVHADYGH